jgi:16S rRNA (cytosine967-C5)-methyltransferase
MTPSARLSAAIEVLDRVLAGAPVEQVLTNWARGARYAGSTDRAELRDIVFDCLRSRTSFAALGGGLTGRGLVLGLARGLSEDPAQAHFTDGPHAPAPPDPVTEAGRTPTEGEALNIPDWLQAPLQASLGADFKPVLAAMANRAPVFLRVNPGKTSRPDAILALAAEGITAQAAQGADLALEVTGGARKIRGSKAYAGGLVELQDLASQQVIEALPLADGMRVLDYCAGGGGKTLAMAARAKLVLYAHDAAPRRMADLDPRAKRAGVRVTQTAAPATLAPYDLVLVDAPCSGSGSWRRDPEGKWLLTPEKLQAVIATQAEILDQVAPMVRQGGWLAYVTCSMLDGENRDQIARFQTAHPGWSLERSLSLTPLTGGDGFFLALLRRSGT